MTRSQVVSSSSQGLPTGTTVVICLADAAAGASPLHPLNATLRLYLLQQLRAAEDNPAVTSLILTGGGPNFSAGADLTEFASLIPAAATVPTPSDVGHHHPHAAPSLIDVVTAIEACRKPIVAAIDGVCLGGGCELALACHARVATSRARLGLPEVHVGVIPGAGGTQRLPKLVGLRQALPMILQGSTVSAASALRMGLLDAIAPEATADSLRTTARQWAAYGEVLPTIRRTGDLQRPESPAEAHALLHVAELSLPPLGSHGMRAAIQALRASGTPIQHGMRVETTHFLETLGSPQGRARRHVFFATRRAQKVWSPVSNAVPTAGPRHGLWSKADAQSAVPVAVVGAGTMGSGIALVLLQAGFHVTLVDVHAPALAKGMEFLKRTLASMVQRRQLKPTQLTALEAKLRATSNLQELSQCLLVVEAVVEKLIVKQSIFATLDKVTPPTALLLSNTSTLDIDAMASAVSSRRRGLFAGWHFFSPAHRMKLVEIVRGSATSDDTTALLQALTKQIGKIGVVVGNCDGFCGNRMLKPYSAETVLLLTETQTTVAAQDYAIRGVYGMALGPFEMADLAGNDVGYNIRVERQWARRARDDPLPPNRPARYTELPDVMISDYGRLGQKVGKGWYDYDSNIGKGRKPLPSSEMDALIRRYLAPKPSPALVAAEIIERVLYPLINEGFKCLEESIVRQPSDIDVVYVYGYGWPVWRGGPMYAADHEIGLPRLLRTLRELSKQFPTTEHYVPSALLVECVARKVTVEEYYQKNYHTASTGSAMLSKL